MRGLRWRRVHIVGIQGGGVKGGILKLRRGELSSFIGRDWYRPGMSATDRTENSIVAAAVRTWAVDRTATLPEIAEAADVETATLHDYFSDRADLAGAAVQHAREAIDAAIVDAKPDSGNALAAMRRVVFALATVGDAVMFVVGDRMTYRDVIQGVDSDTAANDPVLALIRRGQEEGVIDSRLGVEWIHEVLWSLCNTAFEQVERGSLPKFDVPATVIRTLEHGIYGSGGPV